MAMPLVSELGTDLLGASERMMSRICSYVPGCYNHKSESFGDQDIDLNNQVNSKVADGKI
jgi:hypothetical protein